MKPKFLDKISNEENLTKVLDFSHKKSNKKILISSFIVFCFVFTAFFLYQPARDLYISVREQDKLNAQYEALKATNQNLTDDIERLQTEDGVRQRAIDALGLIQQGESIGYVAGSEITDGRENSASETSSKLAYKNIKTPQTWYSPILNFIFGVYD